MGREAGKEGGRQEKMFHLPATVMKKRMVFYYIRKPVKGLSLGNLSIQLKWVKS